MAEILLSLTIIGVVAAITLPSLTGNINERTWNTQRKALYARISQAVSLMPSLNRYGTYKAPSGTEGTESYDAGTDNTAETFVTNGLAKVLKINNICTSDHLTDCGFPEKITPLNGDIINPLPLTLYDYNETFSPKVKWNTKVAGFETQNGESIAIFYNPNCVSDMSETNNHYRHNKMCANLIYDLNGTKGPNTVGKDIGFMTIFYPTDSVVVSVMPLQSRIPGSLSQTSAGKKCKEINSEARLPNREELNSMYFNKRLVGSFAGGYWWTSSRVYSISGLCYWLVTPNGESLAIRNGVREVWCVKR